MKNSVPVFPKPLDDLLQKLGRSSQSYARELAQKLARQSQEAIETLIKHHTQKVTHVNQGIEELYRSVFELAKQIMRGPDIRFNISSRDLRKAQIKTAYGHPFSSESIEGKAAVMYHNGSIQCEVDCVVASTNWEKLKVIKLI